MRRREGEAGQRAQRHPADKRFGAKGMCRLTIHVSIFAETPSACPPKMALTGYERVETGVVNH